MSFGDAVKGDWGWLIVGGLVFVVGVALAVGILEGAMGDAGTVPSPAFCCDAPATGGTAVECTDGLTKRGGLGRYDDQCELPDYSRGVVQTWATWSNLPFILFGLLIALRNGWSFKDTDMPGVAVASTFVGITFILIGAMSMAFHGQMTPSTQDLDIWAIYFGLLALLATTLVSTWAQLRESWWGAALLCLIAFGGFVAYARSDVKFFQSEYFVPFLAGLVIVAMILRLCWAIKDDADGAWHARFWVPFGLALAFLGAGVMFTIPILSDDPLPIRMSYPARALDLGAEVALHAFFGVFLMVSPMLVTDYFANAPAWLTTTCFRSWSTW